MKKCSVMIDTWLVIVIWCSAYIFTKVGLYYLDELSLSVYRYLSVGIVAFFYLIIKKVPLPKRKDLPTLIALSATGFFLYVITYNLGASKVSVSTASVIIAAAPLVTAAVASIFFHEKMGKLQVVALILSFIGTAIVCLWDGALMMNGELVWIVLSMLCFTAYNLLAHFKPLTYTALETTVYTLLITAVAFLFFLPSTVSRTTGVEIKGIMCVLYLGIVCSGLAYWLWNRALSHAEQATSVTNALFAEPVITSLMGWLAFQEIPSVGTLIGGLIILVGLYMFKKGAVALK